MNYNKEQILEALKHIIEPDLNKDIVELGLVSDIKIEDKRISLKVKISNPAMHNRKRMEEAVEFNIHRFLSKDVELDISIEGISTNETNPNLRKVLPGVKNIIAIASGKGGVGKSTVTANLALGLAKKGYKVGLVDADIYGPSMPIMLDCADQKPTMTEINGKSYIKPVESYGIKLMSIGFFADLNKAIVWRGAMASKAIRQMFIDAHWGDLDYLLIDLPPGTSDIHLTIVQLVPITGAVIVSTPQDIALADARKGINMFELENIKVPVLGLIENMAYFTPEELPNNKYYIFGRDGVKNLSEQMNVPVLGEIPLVQSIREAADVGRPAVLQEGTPSSISFDLLASSIIERVAWRNKNLAPTAVVKMTN